MGMGYGALLELWCSLMKLEVERRTPKSVSGSRRARGELVK